MPLNSSNHSIKMKKISFHNILANIGKYASALATRYALDRLDLFQQDASQSKYMKKERKKEKKESETKT